MSAAPCEHKWVPGGMVTMPYVEHSPVSRTDDYHGERVYQIVVCEKCAATTHRLVAER